MDVVVADTWIEDYDDPCMTEETQVVATPQSHLFSSSTSCLHDVPIEKLLSPNYQPSEQDFRVDQAESTETEEDFPTSRQRAKVGRKEKEITKLLILFRPTKVRTKKVKKEYLRVLVLRGFKRAIRDVMEGVKPRKKVHGFSPGDGTASRNWGEFRKFVRRNRSLEECAPTENGPGTEGKAKKPSSKQAEAKTFNDKFCRGFFADSLVREAFHLYLNVIFSSESIEDWSHRFKFETFGTEDEKVQNWNRLKTYLYRGMFQELKLPENNEDDQLVGVKP